LLLCFADWNFPELCFDLSKKGIHRLAGGRRKEIDTFDIREALSHLGQPGRDRSGFHTGIH